MLALQVELSGGHQFDPDWKQVRSPFATLHSHPHTLHVHPHTPRTPNPTLTTIFHLLASWRAASAHYRRIRWAQGLPTTRYTPPSTDCGVRRGGQLVSHPSAKHPHHDMSTRHVRRGPPSLWAVVPSLLGVSSGLLSLRTTPHPSAHGNMTRRRDTYEESC